MGEEIIMFEEFLPDRLSRSLGYLNKKGLKEIRIRVKMPIIVDYGSNFFLGESGIVDQKEYALSCSFEEMQDIIFKACECSVYAYNEELKLLYITLKEGQRVGVCGEVVCENGIIKTIKNFSSISIRIAHQVPNCSLKALSYLFDENGVFNTLIVAPPGAGKTTFLRDFCYQISSKNIVKNLLILDERGEIAPKNDGEIIFNVGHNTDVLTYSTKKFGLENGIRVFCPTCVAMDEIAKEDDALALMYAIGSGVKIIATAHAENISKLFDKPFLKNLLSQNVFERIVVLSNKNGTGTLEGIYDKSRKNIFLRG